MLENLHFDMLGEGATLSLHFDAYPRNPDSTTLVGGRGYLCRHRSDLQRPGLAPYPDLVVAFDVDLRAISASNGYDISEVGKPPELVLEIGSPTTGKNDYTAKRFTYANLGVAEYWRFDHTGGRYHDAPLGGDRLTPAGVYRPIALRTEPDGVIWGYSEALKLSLCWVAGRLRYWDPANGGYIPDHKEERDARLAAQERAAAAETRANAERDARIAAEERIRRLEAELRRRENP